MIIIICIISSSLWVVVVSIVSIVFKGGHAAVAAFVGVVIRMASPATTAGALISFCLCLSLLPLEPLLLPADAEERMKGNNRMAGGGERKNCTWKKNTRS